MKDYASGVEVDQQEHEQQQLLLQLVQEPATNIIRIDFV